MRTENEIHFKGISQRLPVGLTGGIATGKTTVAGMFRSLGATIIHADIISAAVLNPGTDAMKELTQHFGPKILLDNGALNRSAMLDILIHEPGALQQQLDILRPHILPAIDRISHRAIESEECSVVIVEAPLLFEYGLPERYHPIVLVSIPREIQIERLMERSGKDEAWAKKVIDLQWPLERKEKLADYVIENDKRKSHTHAQVVQIYKKLIEYFTR
ncbi:dephospho-CoA kinase [bacterium]|nr:dephospho-CoA kinase [candidate division CSSED10-310 bacterium]